MTAPGRKHWPTAGWLTAPPAEQGMDEQQLLQTDRHISAHLPNVSSLLVIRHGYLVFERYYDGRGPAEVRDTQSVAKSVISALVGIALAKGYLNSLEQTVLSFFPDYASAVRDERMGAVTLRHLLTMSAGFANEVDEPGVAERWYNSDNPTRFTLAQPLQSAPGHAMQYSNMDAHLLSSVLTRATGMTALDFAKRFLFTPLGIQRVAWPADAAGNSLGSSGLWLAPRDMAKFGYLYLNHGHWQHATLLSPAWVSAATQPYYPGDPRIESIEGYGYLWWIAREHDVALCYAAGYGGQYIGVVQDLDLVVVMTGDTSDISQDHRPIISDFVLPAVQKA
jgi:CubicO group peptidase (beta-lactamase class C family)